ncbi:MAG: MBL fold metallo-hydrolase [Propionibacteriaceae bacterium]|nr:MBL fold metallo-hydrolase [Propionibacteriaceae bacterium]
MLIKDVADGVHRIADSYVNCYVLEGETGVSLIDTGLPSMWSQLMEGLEELNHAPAEISAIVLTHAHFDHVGCAARAKEELQVPIWAHVEDHYLAAHPYRYKHEKPRLIYPLRYPRAIRILAAMTKAGALSVRGVQGLQQLEPNAILDIPGRPRIIFTPGHTAGHCALHLGDRSTVITGDALVTLDPYTGHDGPQIVAGAATADSAQALASLDLLAATRASTVLPGHGEPWLTGIQAAVDHAKTHHTTD